VLNIEEHAHAGAWDRSIPLFRFRLW